MLLGEVNQFFMLYFLFKIKMQSVKLLKLSLLFNLLKKTFFILSIIPFFSFLVKLFNDFSFSKVDFFQLRQNLMILSKI